VTTKQTLGQRLAQLRREKAARERRDIQQLDMARAAGVSKTAVSRYERDIDVPREATLEKLAAYLDSTPEFIRYGVQPERMVAPDPALDRRITDAELENARATVEEQPKRKPDGAHRRKSGGGGA
jgi:transcriptional regulator with XRE-family HTH domain